IACPQYVTAKRQSPGPCRLECRGAWLPVAVLHFFKKAQSRSQAAAQLGVVEPEHVLPSRRAGHEPDHARLLQADKLVDEQINNRTREIARCPPSDRLAPWIDIRPRISAGQFGQQGALAGWSLFGPPTEIPRLSAIPEPQKRDEQSGECRPEQRRHEG